MARKHNLPEHVAIIMDGNGRWAKKRSFLRTKGHEKGADTVRSIITETRKLNIQVLTLYTFSLENFGREKQEVNFLMNLLEKFLAKEEALLQEKNISFKALGDLSYLPSSTREKVCEMENKTSKNTAMRLNLALAYGGRQEILGAFKKIALELKNAELSVEEVLKMEENQFSEYLYTAGLKEPDLMIRTGGEFRISNFLLWQMAYTEFYFTSTLWPDFTIEEYYEALQYFSTKERRFGLERPS